MSPIGTFKIISPLLGNPLYTSTTNYKMVPYSNAASSYMTLGRFNGECDSMAFAFSSLVKI